MIVAGAPIAPASARHQPDKAPVQSMLPTQTLRCRAATQWKSELPHPVLEYAVARRFLQILFNEFNRIIADLGDRSVPVAKQRDADGIFFEQIALDEGALIPGYQIVPEIVRGIEGKAGIDQAQQVVGVAFEEGL